MYTQVTYVTRELFVKKAYQKHDITWHYTKATIKNIYKEAVISELYDF